MLSQTAEYALRTLVYLARRGQRPARVDEIAAALGLPRNYLSKILHRLAHAGVLTSTRGRGGGFRLGAPPDRIRLLDIVQPFDDVGVDRRCLLGQDVCSDSHACEAHAGWKEVAGRIANFFSNTTIADLAAAGGRPHRRRAGAPHQTRAG